MNNKEQKKEINKGVIEVSTSTHNINTEKLKRNAKTGDLESYKLLFMYYDGKKMDEDFLSISKEMYEKYNSTIALNKIYLAYIYKYNPDQKFLQGNLPELFNNVPPQAQEEALNYLKKGVELGDYSCIEDLSDYYLSIGEIGESKELLVLKEKLIQEHKKKIDDSSKRH